MYKKFLEECGNTKFDGKVDELASYSEWLECEIDNVNTKHSMEINAIYVKSTKEILYSRENHDMKWSEDKSVAIDGGFEYVSIIGDMNNIIPLKLNGAKLLRQILHYDWRYGNNNSDDFPDGYHGRFKIVDKSNFEFYEELIINFDDIKEEFINITNKRKKFTVLENPEPITMGDIECVKEFLKNKEMCNNE